MNGRGNIVLTVIILILLVSLVSMVMTSYLKLTEAQKTLDDANEQLEETNDKVDELEYQLEKVIDDEYIMRIAREKLGLHLPEEKIFYYSKGN